MKIATFVVVDDKLSSRRGEYVYTVNGDVIYPLETPLPVIQRGKGCIGVALVNSSTRTKSSTTINFAMSKVSKTEADAYYTLYRNQISMSNSEEDAYENASDMVIPGMMTSAGVKPKTTRDNRNSSRTYGTKPRSLSDIYEDDDDYHWD